MNMPVTFGEARHIILPLCARRRFEINFSTVLSAPLCRICTVFDLVKKLLFSLVVATTDDKLNALLSLILQFLGTGGVKWARVW